MFYMQRLKDLREDYDLDQIDVARILNTTQSQYSKYERGVRELPIRHLNALADFYETSTDYIMGRTNKKDPYPRAKGLNRKD